MGLLRGPHLAHLPLHTHTGDAAAGPSHTKREGRASPAVVALT